jgi:peroxiredoxin
VPFVHRRYNPVQGVAASAKTSDVGTTYSGRHSRRHAMKRALLTKISICGLPVAIALVALHAMGSGDRHIGGARRANPFRASDISGNDLRMAPGERGPCLLLFFCLCSDCQTLAHQLRLCPLLRSSGPVQVVGVVHADPRQAAYFLEVTEFPGVLLVDPHGSVRQQYQVGRCPNAWLVNRDGSIYFARNDEIRVRELCREVHAWLTAH